MTADIINADNKWECRCGTYMKSIVKLTSKCRLEPRYSIQASVNKSYLLQEQTSEDIAGCMDRTSCLWWVTKCKCLCGDPHRHRVCNSPSSFQTRSYYLKFPGFPQSWGILERRAVHSAARLIICLVWETYHKDQLFGPNNRETQWAGTGRLENLRKLTQCQTVLFNRTNQRDLKSTLWSFLTTGGKAISRWGCASTLSFVFCTLPHVYVDEASHKHKDDYTHFYKLQRVVIHIGSPAFSLRLPKSKHHKRSFSLLSEYLTNYSNKWYMSFHFQARDEQFLIDASPKYGMEEETCDDKICQLAGLWMSVLLWNTLF